MLIFKNFLPARSNNWPRKMESSKATAKDIRQVAGDFLAAEIHLMHHQCTELPTRNYNRQKKTTKQKPQNYRPTEQQMSKKPFDLRKMDKQSGRCVRCGDTMYARGFQCPVKNFSVKCVTNLDTSLVCYQKNQQTSNSFKPRKPKAHQL